MAESLKWDSANLVDPLLGFCGEPDEKQVLGNGGNRRALGNDDQPRALIGANEFGEMVGHCASVMRNHDSAVSGRDRQNVRVFDALKAGLLGSLEIDGRLVALRSDDDRVLEIGIRLEAHLHERASRRFASWSFRVSSGFA